MIQLTVGNIHDCRGTQCSADLRAQCMSQNRVYSSMCLFLCSVQGFIKIFKERYPDSIGTGLPITVADSQEDCHSPEELEERYHT